VWRLREAEARHKERWASWRARYERLACETIRGRMILAMESGYSYSRTDLVALIGGNRDHRGAVTRWLLNYGLVYRVQNPLHGTAVAEPVWLYALTQVGEAWREELKVERASLDAAVR
jgi:hypothetical protein